MAEEWRGPENPNNTERIEEVLRREIAQSWEWIHYGHYPHIVRRAQRVHRHHVLLGIGGNIGDMPRRFEHLWHYMGKMPDISIVESSAILKNPPFGYIEQDDFHNAVLHIVTSLSPKALLRRVLGIEKRFGRKRSLKNAPRTLDIDILFYDDLKIRSERLSIPHPHWRERESVLLPIAGMKGKRWSKRLS